MNPPAPNPSGCAPLDTAEPLDCVREIYGEAMRWRGPDGLVHRIAATTMEAGIACRREEDAILFTACGCFDVPPDHELISPTNGTALTCPLCAGTGGH